MDRCVHVCIHIYIHIYIYTCVYKYVHAQNVHDDHILSLSISLGPPQTNLCDSSGFGVNAFEPRCSYSERSQKLSVAGVLYTPSIAIVCSVIVVSDTPQRRLDEVTLGACSLRLRSCNSSPHAMFKATIVISSSSQRCSSCLRALVV